jgi:hypothetical protein
MFVNGRCRLLRRHSHTAVPVAAGISAALTAATMAVTVFSSFADANAVSIALAIAGSRDIGRPVPGPLAAPPLSPVGAAAELDPLALAAAVLGFRSAHKSRRPRVGQYTPQPFY